MIDVTAMKSENFERQEVPNMPRVYSNQIYVAQTACDLRMTFSEVVRVSDSGISVEDRAVITISWTQAKLFAELLQSFISGFERLNGQIKVPLLPLKSESDPGEGTTFPVKGKGIN